MLNAVAMITVLSISPMMISVVCARRRGMFRTPIKNSTRLRTTTQPTVDSATPSTISRPIMM